MSSPANDLNYPGAAEWLGISTRTLRRLVSDGAIRVRRMGNRVGFPLQELQAYADGCLTPGAAKTDAA